MAHYEARVVETVEYQVFVEAADHNEAAAKAEELIIEADDPNRYFYAVLDRSVEDMTELDGASTTQPDTAPPLNH